MEKKRVLMIAQSNYDFDARIIRYCSTLTRYNYKVDVICLRAIDQEKYEQIDGVNIYRIMKRFNQDLIVSYVIFSIFFLFRALVKTTILVFRKNYSFIHVHNMPDYLVFAALYPKLRKIPVILDIHDLTLELFKEKWNKRMLYLLKSIILFSEKISLQFADAVITVSDPCGEQLISRGLSREKLIIILNVPDFTKLNFPKNNSVNENELHLIYHGTIAKRYGIDNIINSLPIVINKIPNTFLHIYGNIKNKDGEYLNRLVKKLNVEKNVIFENLVPHCQIYKEFEKVDIGFSLANETEYSNFGIPTKVFEYTASGVPVIATDLKSIKSVYSKNSIVYVNPQNSTVVSNEILRVALNRGLRLSLATNARMDFNKINFTVMMDRYLKLVQKL